MRLTFVVAVWDRRQNVSANRCERRTNPRSPQIFLFIIREGESGAAPFLLFLPKRGIDCNGELFFFLVSAVLIGIISGNIRPGIKREDSRKAMSSKRSCSDLTRRSRSPVASEAEMMFSQFQDWCLRTYGDSGKTKTVTRRKYNKILQTLLQGDEADGVYAENSHINAKFKFWVKSKGFQLGGVQGDYKKGASGKPVLYVPIKAAVSDMCVSPCVRLRAVCTFKPLCAVIS